MADKAITELIEATQVTSTDSFVLEQGGTAKRLTGQTLVNYLLRMLDGHGGISSIDKIDTQVLIDTYRITFADLTTFDYYVANGKAITTVSQTNISGLTRTYTITFNDNTSQTFTVTDGRSITSVEQTSVEGLTRTYTITYNDDTTDTFNVTDGRSIVTVTKTATAGLVDTYTITYNDGSTSFIQVSNGAKGDKGDNTYTWIKYAATQPTQDSHSMGDLPDNWIGVYYGPASTAPTDWNEYQWFKIKGETGDTGAPATLEQASVSYMSSTSGSVIPSGSWTATIPSVAQGNYLWTRIIYSFNTGVPVTAYTVSRMGIDGLGSVVSVCDISPDEKGNINLSASDVGATPASHAKDKNNPHGVTAEEVGARPDTWTPTAEEVGARPDTWTPTAEEVGARPSNWVPTAEQVGAAPASSVGTNKVFNKLTDIGITTFPTTMKTVANSMPANSTLMLDSRDIIAGEKYEISNLGIGNAGMYVFMRGNSVARLSLLHIYGATGATTSYMNFGCYAATNDKVVWMLGERQNETYQDCRYRVAADGNTEWINPPMLPGTEYRTTERWNGKVVYKKLLSWKTTSDISGTARYEIPHGITNLDSASLRVDWTTEEWTLPRANATESLYVSGVDSAKNSTKLVVKSDGNSDWGAGRTFYFYLTYCKT